MLRGVTDCSASSAPCGMVSNPTNQNGAVTKTVAIPSRIPLVPSPTNHGSAFDALPPAKPCDQEGERDRDEAERQHGLQPRRATYAAVVEPGDHGGGDERQQQVRPEDGLASDRVHGPTIEPGDEVAQHAPDRDRLERRDGEIAEGEKPSDEKCLSRPERAVCIRHLAPGDREHRTQLGVAEPDRQHQEPAGKEAEHCAQRSRRMQPGAERGHPPHADHRAEGEREEAEAIDAALQRGAGCVGSGHGEGKGRAVSSRAAASASGRDRLSTATPAGRASAPRARAARRRPRERTVATSDARHRRRGADARAARR